MAFSFIYFKNICVERSRNMDNRKEKLLEILQEINKQFLRQEAVNKSCRQKNAQLISNFIDAGGWIACGYSSLNQMFENNENKFDFKQQWLHTLLSIHNYETLLNIPIGTYDFKDLEGFRVQFVRPPAGKKNNPKIGISCNIEKAEEVKEKWVYVQDYCKKKYPSGDEIYNACKELFGTKAKKTQSSGGYYQDKARQSQIELQSIQAKAKEEIEKYQKEIKDLKFKMVQLEEENKKLKQQLKNQLNKVPIKYSA